jgi:hypothetical protein
MRSIRMLKTERREMTMEMMMTLSFKTVTKKMKRAKMLSLML